MKINLCSVSDIGTERTNNEDAVAMCPDLGHPDWGCSDTGGYVPLSPSGALAIVADGMGGANAGEVASSLAIDSLEASFAMNGWNAVAGSDSGIRDFLRTCIQKANRAILAHVEAFPESVGLGTTVVMAWVRSGKAHVAWCGDSRCYCFNPNKGLRLLTKDHSLVQELVDRGDIRLEEAFGHPDNNVITRCLGDVDAVTEPELLTYGLHDGDVLLLCTDGLCGYCRDSLIEKIMYRHYADLPGCRDALLKAAIDAGGQDNITISLCATLPQGHVAPKVGLKGRIRHFVSRF